MPIPVPSHEPHKIKTVRPIAFPTLDEHASAISRRRVSTSSS
jgi:hypothetical protein